ncbi:MAG TPA: transglutaminase-like cysteine peptidase [Alphaproteobacteria bacterium]|nr:transglutaminase-like cysteine peptidase [Alphaproteobacteria bacterium]
MRYRVLTAAALGLGVLAAALLLEDALMRQSTTGGGLAPAAGDDARASTTVAAPPGVAEPPATLAPADPTREGAAPAPAVVTPPVPGNAPNEAPATVAPVTATPPARPTIVYPQLFGAREIRGANFAPFPKWTGLIERQVNEHVLYDGPCSARRFNRCHLAEWRALLKELDGKTRREQIEAVNQFMNRAPYIIDPVNYRVSDYWATPLQFLNKDGDCEDYAIAKYISLRELGFPTEILRIVVLDDLNLGIAHAVLAVYLDGDALILDNQISHVIAAARIRHYRPIYSINEEYWWLHRPSAQ